MSAAADDDNLREAQFAHVAVTLGMVDGDAIDRAQDRRAELLRAGQNVRLGELLLADGLLDKNAALEIMREVRLLRGEAPPVPWYEPQRLLGLGSTGPVFLARQTALDRLVALRLFSRKVTRDPTWFARLEQATRTLARFNHPHLAAGIDFGRAGEQPYFAMEFVDAPNVTAFLQQGGELNESAGLAIARQVADAAAYAAENGLPRIELHPEKLFLTPVGEVKIAEAGFPPLPDAPPSPYTPPESRDHVPDSPDAAIRDTQYRLGAILYAALTQRPWPADADSAPPVPLHRLELGIGRGFSAIIAKLTQPDPGDRFEHWDAVQDDLKAVAANRQPRHAHPAKIFPDEASPGAAAGVAARKIGHVQKQNTGSRDGLALIGAGVALLVLLLYFGNRGGFSSKPPAPPPFVEAAPGAPTTAQRARALWVEAQNARRAWEKAANTVDAQGAATSSADVAEKKKRMAEAFAKLRAPEFAALAYGKAAVQRMDALGLSPASPPESSPATP